MKRDVAILGATGTVGQRMVALLADHPTLRVASLVASPRSAGMAYREATTWRLADAALPAGAAEMVVRNASAPPAPGVTVALSALDSSVARDVERRYAEAGVFVVSNASPHRMDEDVPLVIPEVNAGHLELLRPRPGRPVDGGAIVCNPNCSTIGLVLALAPLQRSLGIESVRVTTLQALSGAGYPGVAAMDMVDNVLPLIPGEEEKLETEPAKILGTLAEGRVAPLDIRVSAQCFRVPVTDGHTASVDVTFAGPVSRDEILTLWHDFAADSAGAAPCLAVDERPDRPQPRLDRGAGGGMTATVGRLRRTPAGSWRFVVLSHNAIRGAAGGAVATLECAHQRGLLPEIGR